jgi:hypothetical protein
VISTLFLGSLILLAPYGESKVFGTEESEKREKKQAAKPRRK